MKTVAELVELAIQAKDEGKYFNALNLCNLALQEAPQFGFAWSQKGNILGFLRNILDAVHAFLKALELDHEDPVALAGLEQCQRLIKENGAEAQYEQISISRAITFQDILDFDIAASWYRCALYYNNTRAESWKAYGKCLFEAGHLARALSVFQLLKEHLPDDQDVLYGLGKSQQALQKYPEAERWFLDILKNNSTHKDALYSLARNKKSTGDFLEAIQYLDKALEHYPQEVAYWYQKAQILNDLKKYPAALEAVENGLNCSFMDRPLLELRAALRKQIGSNNGPSSSLLKPITKIEVGTLIKGRYEVKAVYKGGMGLVYAIWDNAGLLPFPLAAKTFQDRFFHPDNELADIFYEEASTWISLGAHPNIVWAFMVEKVTGKPFLLMEFINGLSLREIMAEAAITLTQSIDFAIQICSGMAYLNQQAQLQQKEFLIHGDLKPKNLLIDEQKRLKITDFGLTRIIDGGSNRNKETNRIAGTPAYMAPELFKNDYQPKPQSDIFSFGVILYEMLCAEKPFSTFPFNGETITSPIERGIPISHSLNELLMSCLEINPTNRPLSFEKIRSHLIAEYQLISSSPYHKYKWETQGKSSEEDEIAILLTQCASLYFLGKFKENIALLDKVLTLNPKHFYALYSKGLSLSQLGQTAEALKCLFSALDLAPGPESQVNTLNTIAKCFLDMEDYQVAIKYCNETLDLLPELPHMWVLYGIIFTNKGNGLRELGQYEAALDCYNQAIDAHAKHTKQGFQVSTEMIALETQEELSWYNRGLLYEKIGDLNSALADYMRSVRINPYFGLAWSQKAIVEFKLNQLDQASLSLNKASQISEQLSVAERELYELTTVLEEKGDLEGAASIYEMLTSARPHIPAWWIGYGLCYSKMGQVRLSIACYNHAIELDSTNYIPWLNKAIELHGLEEFASALTCIEEVLKIVPEHENAKTIQQECLMKLSYQ